MSHRRIWRGPVVAGLVLLLTTAGVYGATTWYVDDDAADDPGPNDPTVSDPNETGTLEHPFDAIQEAMDAAGDGDTVLVLDGTYTGVGNRGINFGGKALTLQSENGANTCIIDCQNADCALYFLQGETAASIVDGFTITHGSKPPPAGECSCIGGIYIYDASPIIRNCTITENGSRDSSFSIRGGGVRCHQSDVQITHCTISGNIAELGGGICCFDSNPTITDCVITGNFSDELAGGICVSGGTLVICGGEISGNYVGEQGGGLYCGNSEVTITDCTITRHYGLDSGGGVDCEASDLQITNCTISHNGAMYGGGIYCSDSNLRITNCAITQNSAANGAGIYAYCSTSAISGCDISSNVVTETMGGGLCCENSAATITDCTITHNGSNYETCAVNGAGAMCSGNVTFTNCQISNNNGHGGEGGGVCCAGTVVLTNCAVTENEAGSGAGVYHTDGSLTLVNCALAQNTAAGRRDPGVGGGVWTGGSSLTVTACTIVANSAEDGGGGMNIQAATQVNVTNSVLWDNQPAEISGMALVTYSDVQGGWSGTGNLDGDPLFVDANTADYHLTSTSPCVNAGTNYAADLPAEDLDGAARIQVCRTDIGAYESPYVPALSDCNGNGQDDACDIYAGDSSDADKNHIPDECETLTDPNDVGDNGLSPYCGTGACGPGVVGYLPLTLLGVCFLKVHQRRTRGAAS